MRSILHVSWRALAVLASTLLAGTAEGVAAAHQPVSEAQATDDRVTTADAGARWADVLPRRLRACPDLTRLGALDQATAGSRLVHDSIPLRGPSVAPMSAGRPERIDDAASCRQLQGCGVAAGAAVLGAGLPTASPATTTYKLDQQFTFPSTTAVPEGMTTRPDGTYVISWFNKGTATSYLEGYTPSGRRLFTTGALPIAHNNALAFGPDGLLYGINAAPGVTDRSIKAVDLNASPPAVVRTLPLSSLTTGSVVAWDASNRRFIVIEGETAGPYDMKQVSLEGSVTTTLPFPNLGILQGLQVVGDKMMLLSVKPDRTSSRITTLDLKGTVLRTDVIARSGEPEGLVVDARGNRFFNYLGTTGAPNARNYKMSAVQSVPAGAQDVANPGGEDGPSTTTASRSVAIPSWAADGMTILRYGTGNYPAVTAGPPRAGSAFFAGGTSVSASIRQVLDVGSYADAVDLGRRTYELSAWLGGYQDQTDRALVKATFRDGVGSVLGSATIGPVTAAHRGNVTKLLPRSVKGVLPPGTRIIDVVATSVRGVGTNNDGYADDVSLTVS